MKNYLLTEAEKLLGLGLSVIPVNDQKKPLINSWKKYQSTFPNEQELKRWFSHACGIAIITGKISNIIVIDDDRMKNGLLPLEINAPIISKTKNGGRHYYFAYRDDIKTKVCRQVHIDVRAEGGYVVVPPSHGYEWIKPITKENIANLPEVTGDILEIMSYEKNGKTGENLKKIINTKEYTPIFSYRKFTLPEKIYTGERDCILYKYACQLAFRPCNFDQVKDLLNFVNSYRCIDTNGNTEPLAEAEVEKICRSAFNFYSKSNSILVAKNKQSLE